jgi:hypothetical protein
MSKRKQTYSKEFLEHIKSIHNKRAKVVIDHIMQHGFITTEDLENTYDYSHPPRAARDVREAGIPLETFKIKSKKGKFIAAYKFGDMAQLQSDRFGGRALLPKGFKKILYEACHGRCAVCNGEFAERYLQVDHRVPYEVGGDVSEKRDVADFMLLCGSCNRAKSWSCENCENWKIVKNLDTCSKCYWSNPTDYSHIALKDIRRLDLQWNGCEVKRYDAVKSMAEKKGLKLPDFVKKIIENATQTVRKYGVI